ncbi:MAG: hypothetical protein ACJ76Y_30500 [Thermoanaerobaculia bacterium]
MEELVAQITDENRHEEIAWGPPMRREILDSGPRTRSSEIGAAKMNAMKAMTCRIVDGRVEVPAELAAEGSQVVVLVPAGGEPVRLSPEEEQYLFESMEEIRRGEFVDGRDLLNELRSRHL